MATQLNGRILTTQEMAPPGYTHMWVFKVGETLTETTANTSMVFNLFLAQAGDVIEKAALHLCPAFSDASDAAFNSVTISAGDAGSAIRFFNVVQANINGTEVIDSFYNTAYGPYTTETQVTATVASMAAKKLSELDIGKAILYLKVNRGAVALEAAAG